MKCTDIQTILQIHINIIHQLKQCFLIDFQSMFKSLEVGLFQIFNPNYCDGVIFLFIY